MTLNNLKNEAQHIRLSADEKAHMRANIFGVPSPVQVTKSPYMTVSHYHWFSARFMTAMAALLVVVLGGGTVYASQAALPGDALYTVKVSVAEPVRAALAFSDEAKLSVHTEIAEERLEEAQALAAEGRLSTDAALQIESSLEAHVEEVETLALRVEEIHPDIALEVSETLESALAVNSAILATLGDESDDDDTKKNSHSLASKAQSRIATAYARNAGGMGGAAEAMTLMVPGTEVEDTSAFMATSVTEDAGVAAKSAPAFAPQATATATEAQIKAAGQMEVRALRAVSDVKQAFAKSKEALDSSTARITLEIEAMDERMKTGAELESMGDYAGAKDLYLLVYKDATALSTFIKAEQKFNKKILNALLNERFGVRALEVKVEDNGELEIEKGERVDDDNTQGEVQGATSSHPKGDDSGDEEDRDNRNEDDDNRDSDNKGSKLPVKIDIGL
jgi:hypothetical protein